MNKQKLLGCLHYRMRLWPIAGRKIPRGPWLPRIDDEWVVSKVDPRGILDLFNPRTGHVATLGHDRIHHFEHERQRDRDGLTHGRLILHTQLVLSGNSVHYLPHQRIRAH